MVEGRGGELHVAVAPRVWSDILSISPAVIASLMALGLFPSTWQPMLKQVPRISLTVPVSSLEKDLNRIVRAISMISSRGMLLLCLMFFSFFRSRGGSFSARMMSDEALGTTETAAWRFWMVSLTVTRSPFCNDTTLGKLGNSRHRHARSHTQSPVALAISSPTFLGERPRGPILGASVAEDPTSPPVARRWLFHLVSNTILRQSVERFRSRGLFDIHDLDLRGIDFGSCESQTRSAGCIVYREFH